MPSINDLFGRTFPCRNQQHSASAGSSPNVELQMLSQSTPQLTSSLISTLLVPLNSQSVQQQRHSTGNLAVTDQPKKGILKRPHTFHSGNQRKSKAADSAKKIISPPSDKRPWQTATGNSKQKQQTPMQHQEQKQETMKSGQHVEFADKNAVTVFGDTTTDTDKEGGFDESVPKFTSASKNTAVVATISPVIRKPDKPLGSSDIRREHTPPSEEGSETSSRSGVSHIVGKWWFGKSTKFIVHCDRKGCNGHGHGNSRENTPTLAVTGEEQQPVPCEPYLTPTQRRQREISGLKKELRRAQLSCREKERHLGQLKERLDEIERLMTSSSGTQMVQYAQLRQRLAEQGEEFEAEKRALIASHEHRVRHLNQEMMDLRTELARKEKIIKERDPKEQRDQGIQVSGNNNGEQQEPHSPVAPLSPSLVPATAKGWTPPEEQRNTEYTEEVPFGGEEKMLLRPAQQMTGGASKSAPVSPCKGPQMVQVGTEVLATLEAYRAETVVWRTRTAQLELILQDLLLREGVRAANLNAGDRISVPIGVEINEEMKASTNTGQEEKSPNIRQQTIDEELKGQQPLKKLNTVATIAECQKCMESKHRWTEEEVRLTGKMDQLEKELDSLRMKNTEAERELENIGNQLNSLKIEHTELAELAEKRLCEIKVIQMSLKGIQSEKSKLEEAVSYLERRCHVMQQIGLDQGIVLVEIDEFRRAPGDVFTFRGSKATQTSLTASQVFCNERELDELQIRIQALQITFSEDKAQMNDQLKEIGQILKHKTELITSLTTQLEEAAKNSRKEDERHQEERDAFVKRVEELGRVAERVPILESELERARVEKSHCELKLKSVQEAEDEKMEMALERRLRETKLTEEYWAEKLSVLEQRNGELVAQLERARKISADERIQWDMERVELDHRLQSAIEHVALLNSKLNCPRRDAQVDVRPKTTNKYVVCRPNQMDKAVGAELRDAELEELKAELNTMEAERQWMQAELGRMDREMTERIQERMSKRRLKRLPELTVSFHRQSNEVQFGGHSTEGDQDHLTPIQPNGRISITSLPAVLDYSEGDSFRPIGHHREIAPKSATPTPTIAEDEFLVPRESSLPLLTVNGKLQEKRCHSAPRVEHQQQAEQQIDVLSMSVEPDEAVAVESNSLPYELATQLRDQVQQLRGRVRELLSASERRGSSESAQREARLDYLFSQLESWLYALSDGERSQSELRRRIENFQRERDVLRAQLRDALAELEVYRTEPRWEAWERVALGGKRSSSVENLGYGGRPPLAERQLRRWKEVNQLRKRVSWIEEERLRQRNQLAILRGELAMAKCQQAHRGRDGPSLIERRKGSVDRDRGLNDQRATLESYNRWLGLDRWQSVPELDEADQQHQAPDARRKRRDSAKEAKIVQEALKKQLRTMKEQFIQMENRKRDELESKDYELKKCAAECELLRRENLMYEEKCVEMDKERQQMYLIMFRKGQQAANMELREEEEEMDKSTELRVVIRFLHDAFFYYLLNKGGANEHLQAIMTMLNFTPEQKEQVYKRRGKSH